MDYCIVADTKLGHFHKVNGKDFQRFNKSIVKPDCNTFEHACVKIGTELSSIGTQENLSKLILDHLLTSVIDKISCTIKET